MCSNTDIEHDGEMLMEKVEELVGIGKLCRKCGDKTQVAQVVLRKKDAYCKLCFLSSVKHKFRACLGKSKTMRPGDKVLVAFSGGDNSVALLHLIRCGVQEMSHKKLMFDPFIVYIDESQGLNILPEHSSKVKDSIIQVWNVYEYPKYIVPLELSLEPEESVNAYLSEGCFPTESAKLKNLLDSLPDSSSKIDILNKLRNNLLAQVAKSLGCNKLFTSETANDLAMKLITNVSLGRGAQLPFDVGFSDDRYPDLKVIRPLRDLSKKELVFYNVFHNLSSAHVPSLLTKADPHSSIHRLTESFLSELQDGFPSTLSTVFRVADKLTTNSEDVTTCPLCKAPVDTDKLASSSLNATQFSRLVSSSGPSSLDAFSLTVTSSGADGCNSEGDKVKTCSGGSCCSKTSSTSALQNLLCYGCYLIVKDADMAKFPADVRKQLQELSQRLKMKREIEEFLL